MATFIQKRVMSFFARSSGLSIRQTLPARHNPGLKRKNKPLVRRKKRPTLSSLRKTAEVVPPIDPESLLNTTLLEASRQRRPVELSPEEKERRTLLLKEWSRHKMQEHKEDLQRFQELERCREEALKELKKSSPLLYEAAIKVDANFFPIEFKGPTETPPIPDYLAPDMEDVKAKNKGRR